MTQKGKKDREEQLLCLEVLVLTDFVLNFIENKNCEQ